MSQELIAALTPFLNGCSFRAIIDGNNTVRIEPGCYLLINLVQGFERQLYRNWLCNSETPFPMTVQPEVTQQIMKLPLCKWCGGTLIKKGQQ